MNYVPDMLRYVTGYKFFINSDGRLIYPPALIEEKGPHYKEHFPRAGASSYAPFPTFSFENDVKPLYVDMPKMHFDLLKVEDQINDNNIWFENSLRFETHLLCLSKDFGVIIIKGFLNSLCICLLKT